MNLKQKLTPGGILTLSLGFIHVNDIISKKSIDICLRSQVSVYRTIGPLVYFWTFYINVVGLRN